jgi:hypothetical protein
MAYLTPHLIFTLVAAALALYAGIRLIGLLTKYAVLIALGAVLYFFGPQLRAWASQPHEFHTVAHHTYGRR